MKNCILILISITMLWSCERKHITGNVIDNLGNPIEGVSVTVKNTDFKTQTTTKGLFTLDYAPGEIAIIIEKEGYTNYQQDFVITEKSKYPLGQIELVKIPENNGMYLVSSGNYIKLDEIQMDITKEMKESYNTRYMDIHFYIDKDSILNISGGIEQPLKFIDYTRTSIKLVKIDKNLKAANFKLELSQSQVLANYCTEEIKKINNEIKERVIVVEKGQTYAFINIVDFGFTQKMSDVAYAFKIE